MSHATWQILPGDCRASLATLDAGSVQTCVTSPPYFGLRDYGTGEWENGDADCDHLGGVRGSTSSTLKMDGRPNPGQNDYERDVRTPFRDLCDKCGARRVDRQIGLEPTPDEFVAALVEVFREVRRVLRDDGTVWLNLGSSYFTPNGGAGGSDPSLSRQPQRAPACDSDDTAPQGSTGPDSACRDLCDGCRAATQSHHAHSGCTDQPHGLGAQPLSQTARDSEHPGSAPASLDASPPGVPASTTLRSSEPPRDECSHCSNCGACLEVLRSSVRDARACARTASRMSGTDSLASVSRNPGTDASGMAWVNYTRTLKPKDLIPTPWMVAMALQADGWYLRSDIIWHKSNPMPESVTDRPTKAHEYLFLLSKRPSYYFDADAIREESAPSTVQRAEMGYLRGGKSSAPERNDPERFEQPFEANGRNKRSVWTVATQPFAGAHFATMPPKLIEPCILAGCPEGGTVLDPFAGAGTTGMVALRHNRSFVGCELSPEYVALARDRIIADSPLLNTHAEAA